MTIDGVGLWPGADLKKMTARTQVATSGIGFSATSQHRAELHAALRGPCMCIICSGKNVGQYTLHAKAPAERSGSVVHWLMKSDRFAY
jgi:hypothetical protein